MSFEHKFVSQIPEVLESNILYVCLPYDTCIHRCACGCGEEVVTPLSPHDWKLTYNGETVSLYPSIGNWSFACKSHYWIKAGRISWAGLMTVSEIQEGRDRDFQNKKAAYEEAEDLSNWYDRFLGLLRIWF